MNDQILEKWANLILKTGINFKEGQCLRIKSETVHWKAVNMLEKVAYELGAKYVVSNLVHPQSVKNRAQYQKDDYLSYSPEYSKDEIKEMVNERWGLISLGGMEYPEIFSDMDQDKNAVIAKANRELSKPLSNACMAGQCPWTVTALPTPNWAAKILGKPASEETTKELWDIMIPIYRLDKDNPALEWKKHSEKLHSRCSYLDNASLDYVHFTGPGTDLKIYMSEVSSWTGGEWDMGGGNNFLPNIPTEEVFTTPDRRKTEGRVSVTRPVEVLGNQVIGAWFEFKNGEVVDYGASERKDLLDQFFKIDPNAKRLGEVALVDVNSPIYRADKTFYSILFDENAACHIALGKGITMGFKGGDKMSKDELDKHGYNESLLHTDFMIGSNEVSVEGIKKDSSKFFIIKDGEFVI